jgi:putative cell wall-binding protein
MINFLAAPGANQTTVNVMLGSKLGAPSIALSQQLPPGSAIAWARDQAGQQIWDFDNELVKGAMTLYARIVGQPLDFVYDPRFDIPASKENIPIRVIDVSPGVSGGVPGYHYTSRGLPDGLKINKETGKISGTPTKSGPAGTAVITVQDSIGQTKSITIKYGETTVDRPALISGGTVTIPDSKVANPIKPVDVSKVISGGNLPFIYEAEGLPEGLHISRETGVISGIPTRPTPAGKAKVTVTDDDGNKVYVDVIYGEVYDITSPLVRFIRHNGKDRCETAALAVRHAFPNASKVDTVLIATAGNFPDALAASVLAGVTSAPLLLSDAPSLNPYTQAQLYRLAPETVYLLGGTHALSKAVETSIADMPSVTEVIRLGGADRYATAKLVADEAVSLGARTSEMYLATGENFPDALSVASFAVSAQVPVLLTTSGRLSAEASAFIKANKPTDVFVIGGSTVVSDAAYRSAQALGAKVTRLGGTDRYQTSAKLVSTLVARYKINPQIIGSASGENFPDALAGAASVGQNNGILVLTNPKKLSPTVKTLMTSYKANNLYAEVFGGLAAINSDVEKEVKKLL